MLDEAVVGIAGEGNGVQPERIDCRPPCEREDLSHLQKLRNVEINNVVADQEVRVGAERIYRTDSRDNLTVAE